MRVTVVGAGVVGSMHAWQAVERGHEVVQIERETEARGASLRNFGQIWVSGRAAGEELETALRARELWEGLGARVPALGFRPNGSLTLVRTGLERAVAEAALSLPEAAARGYKLLTPAEARTLNPALRGTYDAALYCERDAAVEPRTAQLALRAELLRTRTTHSCRAVRSARSPAPARSVTTTARCTGRTPSCCARAPGSADWSRSWRPTFRCAAYGCR